MSVPDKITRRKANSMVLAEGTTPQDILNFIKEVGDEKKTFDNSERFRGRKDDDTYVIPNIIAPIEGHGLRVNTATGKTEQDGKEYRDVGLAIWNDIIVFGRASIDELVNRYRGLNRNYIQILINMMIQKHYLKRHTERDGIMTLEVITERDYQKWIQKQNKDKGVKEIEDKFKDLKVQDIRAPEESEWLTKEEAVKRYGEKIMNKRQAD
jgi:hypothetical protein